MRKILFTILLIAFGAAAAQNSAFSVISTKVVQNNSYSNLFTSFLTPASSGINKYLPSNNAQLNAAENVSDFRQFVTDAANVAVVKASIDVEPMVGDEMATNSVKFFCFYQVPLNGSGEARGAQARISFRILYELKNTSGSPADLYYGLNNDIVYMFVGTAAGDQRFYQIGLYESDASGNVGTTIYTSGQLTASNSSRPRGIAYANVPANETRYLLLNVWAYAASENGGLGIFKVDATHGISVAFDDEAIPFDDDMNNDPGLNVNGKMKFKLHNWYANQPDGPAMGTTSAFAYKFLSWADNISEAYAVSENVSVVDGVNGITATLDGFELFDFDNLGAYGEERDRRVYIGGTANIYKDGVLKLRLVDCRMELNVSYPPPWGNDAPVTGAGSGMFDTGVSDPAWVNEFNTNGTMRADFVLNSFSTVINNPWYDATITLAPTNYVDQITGWAIPDGGGLFNYPTGYCSFNFTQANAGNAMARMIAANPGGAMPTGITAISADRFWQFGATFGNFSVDVSFDLSGVNGIDNIGNIRILHRSHADSAWTTLDPATYTINGNVISVAGISSFSEFGVGSTGENPLPVELTTFTGSAGNEGIILNWNTATEVNNYGFQVERQKVKGESEWEIIGFVEGHGNSNSPKDYTFVDSDKLIGMVKYRLKQIDIDGAFEYSDIVEVNLNPNLPAKFKLTQNYPNPFNPTTTINYAIPSVEIRHALSVQLTIYDALGREAATLVNESKTPGNYSVQFDASKLSSGIYYYTLRAGDFTATKKMILVK